MNFVFKKNFGQLLTAEIQNVEVPQPVNADQRGRIVSLPIPDEFPEFNEFFVCVGVSNLIFTNTFNLLISEI